MRRQVERCVGFVAGLVLGGLAPAQAGPYTEPGHLAETMLAWADEVEALVRGPLDVAHPELGTVTFGAPEDALGPAGDDALAVVSLGDGGSLTLWVEAGIGDGPGDDFAVFENGFFSPNGFFAELAFVEVSSNGVDFARFDALSLGTVAVPDGGVVDPTDYRNLAGKHPLGEGTGFDLAELAAHPLVTGGLLDLADVTWVRVVDVIGDGSTLDAEGRPILDPYPTAYASGGHDLDAVGVLNLPEPGVAAMAVAGALLAGALARRRRSPACARRG